VGALTFPILQRHVREVLLVTDAQKLRAMRLLWEHLKLTVEPSCAVVLAAVLAYPDRFAGSDVGLILSGGNVDLDRLPEYWAAAE
jgi:threonine dehydratase